MLQYTVRPISDRSWLAPDKRGRSQFTSTWSDTQALLAREVKHLNGKNLVVEIDVREQDIKLDGMLRANAVAREPAAVLAMESTHGPLLYRCDRYKLMPYARATSSGGVAPKVWMHNLRAIALTLEALRAVDRYGATETGQQYTGFKALPAGRAMPPSHMTSEQARNVLYDASGITPWTSAGIAEHYKRARAATHPDRNAGQRDRWDQVETAARTLGIDL